MNHLNLYYLLKQKFNITEASISETDNGFIIETNDGRIFTEADFTTAEIAQAEIDLESEKAQAEAEAAAKRAAAEAKLAALGLTTDDLKALGLGGN